jgi:hypothetical protein
MAENGAEIARTGLEGRIRPGVAPKGSQHAQGGSGGQYDGWPDGTLVLHPELAEKLSQGLGVDYRLDPEGFKRAIERMAPCYGPPDSCQAPGQCHGCGTATEIETRQLEEWAQTLHRAVDAWENNGDPDGFFEDGYLDHTHLSRARDMLAQIDSVITRARRQGGRG